MAKKKKGELVTFSFSVNSSDPKYAKLIAFLNDIDPGARSYIIRQIINSHIHGNSNMDFSLNSFTTYDEKSSNSEEEIKEIVVEEVKPKKVYPPELSNLKNQFG